VACCYRGSWSVGLSVRYCHELISDIAIFVLKRDVKLQLTTVMSPAKMAELIEMSFGLSTLIGPWNHVLDGGSRSLCEEAIMRGGKGRPIVKYRDILQ